MGTPGWGVCPQPHQQTVGIVCDTSRFLSLQWLLKKQTREGGAESLVLNFSLLMALISASTVLTGADAGGEWRRDPDDESSAQSRGWPAQGERCRCVCRVPAPSPAIPAGVGKREKAQLQPRAQAELRWAWPPLPNPHRAESCSVCKQQRSRLVSVPPIPASVCRAHTPDSCLA